MPKLPSGFYSPTPSERIAALKATDESMRDEVLGNFEWPLYSPGTINAWLVFIGPSPGASPGAQPWEYDHRPAYGKAHPGVSEYVDSVGFWDGIRSFARIIFPDAAPMDAYAATMVRNLDSATSPIGPKGSHMRKAAADTFVVLDRVIRPRLVISLGGARHFTDPVFRERAETRQYRSGELHTARSGQGRKWFSLVGSWPSGGKYLYVSASGIHPSLYHVSKPDTHDFLAAQASDALEA